MSRSNKEELEYLIHHGVKGQKWGVVNEDKPSVKPPRNLKELQANTKSLVDKLTPEQKARVEQTQKAHDSHHESDEDPKGWRPTNKQLATVAVGAAAAGLIIYRLNQGKKPLPPLSLDDYLSAVGDKGTPDWVKELAGKPIDSEYFGGLVDNSKLRVWSKGVVTSESFNQKPFKLPVDHEFYRISNRAETVFHDTTYATHSKEDLARYLSTTEFNGPFANPSKQLLKFKASSEVNVPDLQTRLEALRVVMAKSGKNTDAKTVIKRYENLAGGSWKSKEGVKFLAQLRSLGYDAIVDDMDAGIYGESPLVLINKHKFTAKVATPLKDLNFDEIRSNLTVMANVR